MRIVDYEKEATWWLVYRDRFEDGRWITYGREWVKNKKKLYARRAEYIDRLLPKGPGLVVGCAFGFLMEALHDRGRGGVWGADTSDWIHENLDTEARHDISPRILNIDVRTPGAKGIIETSSGPLQWVLTEEMLSTYPDDAAVHMMQACALVSPTVHHFVNVSVRPPFYKRTPAEWQALAPNQSFHDVRGRAFKD